MKKVKYKSKSPLFKVQSIINSDMYYSSNDFPQKIIEGKVFIGIKKTPTDKTLNYILKENVKKYSNE